MMYLLDTHTYYWYRSSPARLPASVLNLVTDTTCAMQISVASAWELAIKTGIGTIDAAQLLLDFEKRETAAGFQIVGITSAQAIRAGLLPLHHRDPFDRLLIAQALDMRVPLISHDSMLDRYGVTRIWN